VIKGEYGMAVIKCPSCGKNVNPDGGKCPVCDNDLDRAVHCPECGSADTSVYVGWGDTVSHIADVILDLFWQVVPYWAHRAVVDEIEYTAAVKYECNSCGKRFKRK